MGKNMVLWTILLSAVLLLCFGCTPKEAPVASLWSDGAWVLYEQSSLDATGKEVTGTLKISAVGKEMIEDKVFHWIEIREDNQKGVVITKILASEAPVYDPRSSFVFWDQVKRVIIQENSQTPEEIPEQHLKRFIPGFVESSKSKRFGNVKDQEPEQFKELPDATMTINKQKITAKGYELVRHYTSSVNLGFLNLEDTTESSTTYFLNSDVPFGGLVKVEHSSSTSSLNKMKPNEEPKAPNRFKNSLICTAFGNSDATTQIIGDPVEKQVLPFPFLKNSGK